MIGGYMMMEEVAFKIADTLGLSDENRKPFVSELTKYLKDIIKVGKYTKRIMISVVNEFWYSCLLHAYALTDEFTLYPILIKADVAPLSSKTFEIDLTGTDLCCVCPIYYESASLGDDVLLSCLINETPVDVKRQWQNKYLPNSMPMTTELTKHPFVIFPKRKLKITFENTHDSVTASIKFYVPGMLLDINKGKKLIETCYDELVKEFLVSIGILEEDEYETEV